MALYDLPILPSLPGLGSGESSYGSAPYAETAARAQARLGLRDRLLAGLAGLGSVQPGAGHLGSFIQALGGSARATWAAKQAALNYAQRQVDQEIARQNAETQRLLAEGAAKIKEPPPPKVPTKQQDYENLVRPVSEGGIGLDPVKARQIVYGLTPDEQVSFKGQTAKATAKPVVPKAPPPAKPPKPPTASQLSVAGVLMNATKAEVNTRAMEDKAIGVGLPGQVGLKVLPNFMQSPEAQKYRQAQIWWIENVLRRLSGATIKPDEYDDYRRIYFAQPGDSKDVLQQKRESRQSVLDQLRFMSGAAAKDIPTTGSGAPADSSSDLRSFYRTQ